MALTIKNNIKKETSLNVSQEFLDEIELQVKKILQKAEKRAKENNRRTLFSRDL